MTGAKMTEIARKELEANAIQFEAMLSKPREIKKSS